MRKTNKFIFACIITVILFKPVFIKNVLASHEESIEHRAKSIGHGEEAAEQTAEGDHENEHVSQIWPHYGKMVIFAEILLAFMIFSFVAPLVHFYVKGKPPLILDKS